MWERGVSILAEALENAPRHDQLRLFTCYALQRFVEPRTSCNDG